MTASSVDPHLSPGDAAVAVRSFPRRFRGVLARPDDDERVDPDEIARRYGPDGTSAAEHLLAADGVLALLDRALEHAASGEALHPSTADLAGARWDDDHSPVGSLLDQLSATADRTADRIERVPNESWGQPVRIVDSSSTPTVLEVVQQGVAVVADHLRAASRVIDAVV